MIKNGYAPMALHEVCDGDVTVMVPVKAKQHFSRFDDSET